MSRLITSPGTGAQVVSSAFDVSRGGQIYVKKIPAMSILETGKEPAPEAEHKVICIRPGEQIHEQMIGLEDAPHTYEYAHHYKILPMIHAWSSDPQRIKDGIKVAESFTYTSENNSDWMRVAALQNWIAENRPKIGRI